MPELPEIETIKRGITSLTQQKIRNVIVRHHMLRYLIPDNLEKKLINQTIHQIERRAKYLVFSLDHGFLLLHLGMSGSLTLIRENTAIKKHDHVDIIFTNGNVLRYNDPRRFGAVIYTDDVANHKLLENLGPEPLELEFNAKYLLECIKNKTSSIKQLIMNNHIVVGVGNIYACEALFLSRILPNRRGNSITNAEANLLVSSIKNVLANAIELGGSTLRDYKKSDGTLGYFQNVHNVYGKNQEPCKICGSHIMSMRIGQRNSFFCTTCQK